MYEAVMPMPSTNTVTVQAPGAVNSVTATNPANTAVVGNFTPAPTATLANNPTAQKTNVDEKDQSSSHGPDRERYSDRSRSRERSRRNRSRSRDRRRDRDRSRDRSRDRRRGRDRDRSRERGRDRSRSRGRDRDRDRSRSRGRDRSHGRYRDRSRSRDRDRRRSRDRSRSRDHERRDEGKRKSRWDTDAPRDRDAKQSSTSQLPPASNTQQLSTAMASGISAAGVQNLLTAGRIASAEQPLVNPLMSSAVNNPSTNNVPNASGRVDPSSSSAIVGGGGPGLLRPSGMPNPAGVVGPNDANKMATHNVGQNMQRFPGNASSVATNNIQGDLWKNSMGNVGPSNVSNSNPPFTNMVGMPQGTSGPDAGRPYQMGNDGMSRFRDPSMMPENTGSNNMNNFMRPQGMTGRFPPPGNLDNVQGFRNRDATAASDNFSGMENEKSSTGMSGTGMSGFRNTMQQVSGGGMHMPVSGEGPRGFTPGRQFPGADNMSTLQGQGARMMFGNISRMPTPNDKGEVDGPRSLMGISMGQRPPYDGAVRFGGAARMPGSDMQSGGSSGGNFTDTPGRPMSGMMSNRLESGMVPEMVPGVGQPGSVRPFFDHSASPRPPTAVPPPLMSQSVKQGNVSSPLPPPPPPPPTLENKNVASSVTPQTFGSVPAGVPAPPPSQGSVTDQQSAEQMQAAMAYYYAQWMQQQQQPPPPPPPPPK